jgi:D-alanyl-lipoteichoic acid acyltransferase DltB (MBOAT superfamily)
MGFDIMKNFRRPYFSKSISEFWHRWHISLSSWFRDYLYIPLGGSRVTKARWIFNIMIVFVVSGLWHGASWSFVVWGALHGTYLVIGRLTRPLKDRALDTLKIRKDNNFISFMAGLITFALVCIGWIIFRADSMHDAWIMIRGIFAFGSYTTSPQAILALLNLSVNDLAFIVLSTAILLTVQVIQAKTSIREYMERRAWPVRWAVYLCLIFGIILLGYYGLGDSSFIYFQF